MSAKRCLVSICHNGPMVFTETARSLMEIGWGSRIADAKKAHGFESIDFKWEDGFPRVDALRNAAAEFALWEGEVKGVKKHRFSHILFLDADMAWPTNVIERMLRHHDKDIVAGFYTIKGGSYSPVAMRLAPMSHSELQYYYYDNDYQETGDDLRWEHVVGMGCTLIRTEIFDKIGPKPWFHYEDNNDGYPLVSEDVPFCRKAVQAGFSVWMDPTVKCTHHRTHGIGEKWHRAATDGLVGIMMGAIEPKLEAV